MKSNYIYQNSARGKLLLTGEYFVLNGASSIAIPSKYTQSLKVKKSDSPKWYLKYHQDENYTLISDSFIGYKSTDILKKLNEIFQHIENLKGEKIDTNFEFYTYIDFDSKWGLGTSSTLIALLADFYKVDAFELNRMAFSGSGYDIACAFAEGPILYQISNNKPTFQSINIAEEIRNKMYFVYLGEKVKSETAIKKFNEIEYDIKGVNSDFARINQGLMSSDNVDEWIELLAETETITSDIVSIPKINLDVPYYHKYLGAWGGDFALILTEDSFENVKKHCTEIGLETVFKYKDLLI